MAISDGEEISLEMGAALHAGILEMALDQSAAGMRLLQVPEQTIARVMARCRQENSQNYVGEFMLAWAQGRRDMPELDSLLPTPAPAPTTAPDPLSVQRPGLDL